MAPTPPNTTLRLKIHYHGQIGAHVMLFHGQTGTTLAALTASVANIIGQMKNCTYDQTFFDQAEVALAGSNIFTPYPAWTPIASGNEFAPQPHDDPALFLQFGGRSTSTGKRAKWYLFECRIKPSLDMRYTLGDDGAVDGVLAALDNESGVIGAIDGTEVVPYRYANVGSNDYLVHKARRS